MKKLLWHQSGFWHRGYLLLMFHLKKMVSDKILIF